MMLKKELSVDEPLSAYDLGFQTGYRMTNHGIVKTFTDSVDSAADPSTYAYYLEYLDWFKNRDTFVSALEGAEIKGSLKEAKLDSQKITLNPEGNE